MKKLISFIGAGRRMEGASNTYEKTTYQFPDGRSFETSIFPEALIGRSEMGIEECVLIGTHGSSWGCLIEDAALHDESLFSLYECLEQHFEEKVVERESLNQLEVVLSSLWGIPVCCHRHQSDILEENSLSILFGYVKALTESPGTEFLVDITHGFRSMPVLLMSAIQTIDATSANGIGLEVIYGEFKTDGPSPVRYLRPLWEGVRFARALRVFNERFDGELLCEFLEKEWPSGAKAVMRMANMIQANFFTKFDEALQQLENAFKKLPEPLESSVLFLSVKQLRQLHFRLSAPPVLYKRLFILAEMLAERRLWGQAITTLQLALEAFVFWKFKNSDYGNYDETKKLLKEYSGEVKGKDREHFHQLRNTRNTIAHGGCRSARGGLPQEGNLPSQYTTYRNFLKRIF